MDDLVKRWEKIELEKSSMVCMDAAAVCEANRLECETLLRLLTA